MDLLVRNGYPNQAIPLPHLPGGDVVGTVARVGREVESVKVGQRVLVYPLLSCGRCSLCRSGQRNLCTNWKTVGIHHHGGYAEEVAVPAENLILLPDGLDFKTAATLPVAGLTAHHALATVGKLAPGEVCVVWGAAGGLGSMALQVSRHLGARTIAVVGSQGRGEEAFTAGADAVINRNDVDVVKRLKELAPEGADLVLDSIGAATFSMSLGMLKNGGRLVSCGILGGRESPLNIHMVYFHH